MNNTNNMCSACADAAFEHKVYVAHDNGCKYDGCPWRALERAEADYKLCFKRMSFEAERHAKVCVERDDAEAQRYSALNANVQAREALRAIIIAWEVLGEGHHRPDVIADWLLSDMKPVIDDARQVLSATPTLDYIAVILALREVRKYGEGLNTKEGLAVIYARLGEVFEALADFDETT